MKILIILLCAFAYVSMLEVTFEMAKINYFNPKFFNEFNLTLRRQNRKSPYIVNVYMDFKTAIGNNLTIKGAIYEVIGGHNVLTPLRCEYRLCDFLNNDPYLGKMFSEQLSRKLTCPFPPGVNNWLNITLHFEFIPYIPFTYGSLFARVHSVADGYIGNEKAFTGTCYAVVKQKLQDKYAKKKTTMN